MSAAGVHFYLSAEGEPRALCEVLEDERIRFVAGCRPKPLGSGLYELREEEGKALAEVEEGVIYFTKKGYGRGGYGRLVSAEVLWPNEDEREVVLFDLDGEEPKAVSLGTPPEVEVELLPFKLDDNEVALAGLFGIWRPFKKSYVRYDRPSCSPLLCDWVNANASSVFTAVSETEVAVHSWDGKLKALFELPEAGGLNEVIAAGWKSTEKVLTRTGIAVLDEQGKVKEHIPYDADKLNYGYVLLGFMPQAYGINGRYGVLIDDYSAFKVDLESGEVEELVDIYELEKRAGEEAWAKLFKGADVVFVNECAALLWSRAFPFYAFELRLC